MSSKLEIETKFARSVSRLNRSILLNALVIIATISIFEIIEKSDNAGVLDLAQAIHLQERQRVLGQQLGRLVEHRLPLEQLDNELEHNISSTVFKFIEEAEHLKEELSNQSLLTDPVLKKAWEYASNKRLDLLEVIERVPKQISSQSLDQSTTLDQIDSSIDVFMLAMDSLLVRTNEIFTYRSQRQDRVPLMILVLGVLAFVLYLANKAMSDLKANSDSLRSMALEKNRLATIAECTSNAVIITDLKGCIQWVNSGFTRITDFTLDDAIGKKPGELLQFEKTDPRTIELLRQAIQAQQPINCQILNRSKYGREYWLDLSIQPLQDEYGNVNGFMAVETDISELKEIEIEIRGQQQLLASTLDSLTSRVVIINGEGFVVNANRHWIDFYEPILGQDCYRWKTTNLFEIICSMRFESEANRRDLITGIKQVLEAKLPCFEFEYSVNENEGLRWYRSVASPCLRDGRTKAVVSTEDITSRVEAERKVRAYASRVQAVFDGSSDAILLLKKGRFIDCNKKALEVFGIASKEELSYLWQFEAMLHALEITVMSPTQTATSNHPYHGATMLLPHADGLPDSSVLPSYDGIAKGSMSFQWLLQRVGGTNFPADVLISTLILDGEPVLLASIRDVSDRQETLRYLDMYRSIVDRHAIVAETDTAGRIVHANEQFCKISGYSLDELLHQNHRILNSGTHPKQFWQDMYKTVANNNSWHGEICNRAKDGRLYWVYTTIAPLVNHSGKIRGYFAIRTDITALKEAESQAQAASDAKSQFLANMSHEIRTPMTAILGFADLLATEVTESRKTERCLEYIETIKRNGEHLLSIINDILDISKIEANKVELEKIRTNPHDIIDEVIKLIQIKASNRGIDIQLKIQPTIPTTIESDPTRIRQILLNLLDNAVKFTRKGNVSLDVTLVTQPDLQIEFVIRDTGIGMTNEQVSRLFTPFYQADATMARRFGGSGLGLQISKRLAVMLGGDLTVKSTHGIGSEFTFCLPIDPPLQIANEGFTDTRTDRPDRSDGDDLGTNPLAGVRILLVEDGIDNQKLIGYHLRKAGADLVIVQNGKEAVQSLTLDGDINSELIRPEPFDLILTDIQMPEMDGYTATRLLRSKGFQKAIIALTANAMASDTQNCIQAGCNEHISKPINSQHLIRTCLFWSRNQRAPVIVDGLSNSTTSLTTTPYNP
jgi:PAS domain S-box-containing protein